MTDEQGAILDRLAAQEAARVATLVGGTPSAIDFCISLARQLGLNA